MQLQSNQPPGEGWGYRLQAADNASNLASVFGHNSKGSGRLEVAEFNGQTSGRAGVSGGFAMLDGRIFMSRRIESSFGVVSVPGFENVRVYVDNQLAGRTNTAGYALLPRLHPYQKNNVSIEQLDLPLDVRLDQLRVYPVPGWRAGLLIDFPIKNSAAATIDLIRNDGNPVPTGAVVTINTAGIDHEEEFVVGDEGLVYLSGLSSEVTLRARWKTGKCQTRVQYFPEKGNVPHLGRHRCEDISSR